MEWKTPTLDLEKLQPALRRLDKKQERLQASRPIPGIALQKIKENLALEWTYNSNSIEGNTLTLKETKMVLEDGLTVGGKSMREHFEAVNHHEAIDLVESLVKPDYQLSERDIMEVHAVVLDKIEKDFAGRYRNAGVRISGANFVPPNALRVSEFMSDLVHWVNHESGHLHPIVQAAIFHHRFVWIHPFFDGNGRTARLLYNLLLMKNAFPPAIILKNDRSKYDDALNKANNGNLDKFALLVVQAAERSLDIYLSNLDDYAHDYQPISNIVEEPEIKYGQEYVSLLARSGKIDAYKEGRVWYTTKEALISYQLSVTSNQ